ncbi:MAG: hypothetical protein GY856_06605 [bacterium]|nr:hypothetical protein [bacterium]
METRALTIHVASEAAQAYETAPPEVQRQLDVFLSRKLRETLRERTRSTSTSVEARGQRVLARLCGSATAGMTTNEILHLTRGEE